MRVIISAGGTGGHIYPALAIINKIKEEEPDSEILYIGTTDRMEKDLIPSLGYKYEALEVKGLKRKLTLDNIKTATCFISAIKRAKEIIKDFDPDIVIGCGGYVTAPVIYAAKKLGKRTFIHEQNSVVGLANKFLSRYTDKVGVSFESTIKDFPKGKAILTGNPCSEKALSIKATTKDKLGVDKDKKLVLIVMGSLGSRSVNDRIFSFVDKFRNKNYSVIIVTGNSYYERVKERRVPDNVKVVPFIYEMPSVMKITDLMVTRAGASTMSEITALGVPAIFIPSPYVANNHQYKNAKDLVDQNAGIMLEEKDMTDRSLIELIDKTLNDKDKIKAALRLGAFDYIIKPFEFERFNLALNNYKSRYNLVEEQSILKQDELDKTIIHQDTDVEVTLPKGLDKNTLNTVWSEIIKIDGMFTTEEISAKVGISRVSIRKYLEFLKSLKLLSLDLHRGSVGRPVYKYKCIDKNANIIDLYIQ